MVKVLRANFFLEIILILFLEVMQAQDDAKQKCMFKPTVIQIVMVSISIQDSKNWIQYWPKTILHRH